MLINGNNNIITAPNIILERTSKRMSDFIDAADSSNNIKGNNNLMQAIRVFDNIMEINGVYPYIKAFFPTIGGTAFSHKFNFMNPAQYEITWTAAYSHSLAGIRHDNTLNSIATSSLNYTDLTHNNTHLMFGECEYMPNTGVGLAFIDISSVPNSQLNRLLIHPRYIDNNHLSDHYDGNTNRMSYVNDNGLGVYFTQRSSSNYAETRKNGIIKSTNTNISNGVPTGLLRIAAIDTVLSSIYTGLFSAIGVGSSMPNTQAIAYSNAVKALLKICGKQ